VDRSAIEGDRHWSQITHPVSTRIVAGHLSIPPLPSPLHPRPHVHMSAVSLVDRQVAMADIIGGQVAVTTVEVLLHFMFDTTLHTVPAPFDLPVKPYSKWSEIQGAAVCLSCIMVDGMDPGGTLHYPRKEAVWETSHYPMTNSSLVRYRNKHPHRPVQLRLRSGQSTFPHLVASQATWTLSRNKRLKRQNDNNGHSWQRHMVQMDVELGNDYQ
jgi:hypothetical protein